MNEFYKKYRPRRLIDIKGQDQVVSQLTQLVKNEELPHFMLFSGPSGCGKTTLARILMAKSLDITDMDLAEYNSASFRGIDMVRDISRQSHLKAIGGGRRGWIIDECHQLTPAAQEAFLKTLEDTPNHVTFIFCTTEPNKLKKTIRNRATEFVLKNVSPLAMEHVINRVCNKEKIDLTEEVMDKLIEIAEGSPRKSLILLQQIAGIDDPEEQRDCLKKQDVEKDAIDLCRSLINPRGRWKDVAKLLKELEHDPEQIRRTVLGYCGSILLKGGNMAPRAMMIFDAFRENLFDTGKPGLIAAAYEMYHNDQ